MPRTSSSSKRRRLTYRSAGVDIARADRLVGRFLGAMRATHGRGVIPNGGGFAGLYRLNDAARGMKDPVLVACTDGVGTKLELARRAGIHNTVGVDLVAMNVNDLVCTGARPLFFLDYIATGKIREQVLADVMKGIVRGCRDAGCALLGGETAEVPGMYARGEYDLAGTAVGIVDGPGRLGPGRVRPGDRIIGLASSGLHSNGFSLVRRIIKGRRVPLKPLLTPTRIYVRPVLGGLRAMLGKQVHSLANITGGGITENLPRAVGRGRHAKIRLGSWPVPKLFSRLQTWGGVRDAEMRRVFNLGIGMAAIVAPRSVRRILTALRRRGQRAWEIGEVKSGKGTVEFVNT